MNKAHTGAPVMKYFVCSQYAAAAVSAAHNILAMGDEGVDTGSVIIKNVKSNKVPLVNVCMKKSAVHPR